MVDLSFYKDKRILVTGHTGFKGTWLCKILIDAGAEVVGYSLEPPTTPSLFELSNIKSEMTSIIGDIRDFEKLEAVFEEYQPEIVFHLAAQPIVRDSYKEPRYTYETNVMGTVNVLECVRNAPSVKSVLNVTTDKVYLNRDLNNAFKEDEPLDGFDPYSNSKSCSELVTHSYKNSFFENNLAVSTARAGNVIGGGDFANDRIIPDCVRAMQSNTPIEVRNPSSTRPFQHVLEPLFAYLLIAKQQSKDISKAGFYNVGPDTCDCVTTGELAGLFCKYWGDGASWVNKAEPNAPHEAAFLKLDTTKIKTTFGWQPKWHIDKTMELTTRFYKSWLNNENLSEEMSKEIKEYLEG